MLPKLNDRPEERFWYAVYVKSRHEFRANELLLGADIEAFLPIVERLRKWQDRRKRVTFPLFPGYLFVHIPKSRRQILKVLKTRGVVSGKHGAAKILGVKRPTLQYRMKKLGINPADYK